VTKRSGASTEFIQEALGHTNIKTTENYLDSFEKEVKRELASKLAAFKNGITKMQRERVRRHLPINSIYKTCRKTPPSP
jgi:hypothetical protein